MLCFSNKQRDKIIHFEGCRHAKRINGENLGFIENVFAAQKQGYRLCKCCNPAAKLYRRNKKGLAAFCLDNQLVFYFHNDAIEIKSVYSQWKLVANDRCDVDLYHRNTYYKKKDAYSAVAGYHLQKAFYRDMNSFLQYIVRHDNYRCAESEKVAKPQKKKRSVKRTVKKGTKKRVTGWRLAEKRIKSRKRILSIKKVYNIFEQWDAKRLYC